MTNCTLSTPARRVWTLHKMEITVTVRLSGTGGAPVAETRRFEALPSGLRELAG